MRRSIVLCLPPQSGLTSLYILVKISSFYIENIFNLFNRTSYLNEEVNGTEPSSSVRLTSLYFAPFYIKNIIHLFNKTSYLNEEVNGTEPPPQVVFPAIVRKDLLLMVRPPLVTSPPRSFLTLRVYWPASAAVTSWIVNVVLGSKF